MRVRLRLAICADIPMDIEIGDHAPIDKLGFDKVPRKLDRLRLCHLAGQSKLDLAGQLRVFTNLRRFDIVPEPLAISPGFIRPFGQHDFAVDDACLVGEVMGAPEPVIVQPLACAIGRSGDRRRSCSAGDGFGREVIDRHGDIPFTAFCARRHDV
ncbi:hypothetical protein BSY18_4121 (plasmid) [Blastomonas sp. RAC04]|nr:hypothetical protein BSY18_4121 [Blastomonas sp. RAC04]